MLRTVWLTPIVFFCMQPAGYAQKVEKVFGGGVFLEGPAAAPDGSIYFSDITNPPTTGLQLGHIWRYDPKSGKTTIFRSPSQQSNGLEFDAAGRLVAVEGANFGGRRVTRTDMTSGRAMALALNYNGRAFNSPNDLTIDEKGRIWFTDPRYSGPELLEQPVQAVYRIDAPGNVQLVIANAGKPNGIVMSPDQKTVYVASNDNGATGPLPAGVTPQPGRRAILAYDIADDGSAKFRSVVTEWTNAGPDGIAVDVQGNIWVAVASAQSPSACAYAPDGRQLRCIPIPEVPSNVAFGRGADRSTLYVTARTSLYRLEVGVDGYQLPAAPADEISIIDAPIPFSENRIRLTREYIKEHYGLDAKDITIEPKVVVLHWTAGATFQGDFNTFVPETLQGSRPELARTSPLNVGIHFLVDRDGTIYRLMPETWMARHVIGLNYSAVGVENVGGARGVADLTKEQLAANVKLVRYLKSKYPGSEYLIGHYEYQDFAGHPLWLEKDDSYRTRKTDPGTDYMAAVRAQLSGLRLKGAPTVR